MKKPSIKSLLTLWALMPMGALCNNEVDYTSYNTLYDPATDSRVKITRENILSLGRPVPADIQEKTTKFLEDNYAETTHPWDPQTQIIDPTKKLSLTQTLITGKGLTPNNLSRYNKIYDIPGTDLIVKASGYGNRLEGINKFLREQYKQSVPYGTQHSEETYNAAQEASGGSLHIATRKAGALRLTEIVKGDNLHKIDGPETHLIHIPGRPLRVADGNYVSVERREPGIISAVGNPLLHDETTLKQTARAIAYANLWWLYSTNADGSVRNSNVFVTPAEKLFFPDLEARNQEGVIFYSDADEQTYRNSVGNGFAHFGELIKTYQPEDKEAQTNALGTLTDAQNEIRTTWWTKQL